MRVLIVILFLFTLIGCNRMEKKIVWDEYNVSGLPTDIQKYEFKDIMFIDENNGLLLGNSNIDDLAFDHIETQLYSTSDGGHTWKQVFSKQGEGECLKRKGNTLLILQTIHPQDYRQDEKSTLCISNDLGQHWDKSIELPFELYNIALINNNYWIGSYEDTVFYTVNAGLNWKTHHLLHPKTDNRPIVLLPTGDVVYMSDNKLISENVETSKCIVVTEFSDKEQHYCKNYVFDKNKGLFLIISNSKFVDLKLFSFSDKNIQLPINKYLGIMNMMVNNDTVLIIGYISHPGRLSKNVFFYSNDNGQNWTYKESQLGYLPYPVTFHNNKIIAYCMRSNTMIQTYLEK